MQVATIDDKPVKVGGGTIAAIVALLGFVAPITSAVATSCVNVRQQESTAALETAKLAQERWKAAVELYRVVLAHPDATQRQRSVRFLIAAGLVDDDDSALAGLTPDQIPQWPAAPLPTP